MKIQMRLSLGFGQETVPKDIKTYGSSMMLLLPNGLKNPSRMAILKSKWMMKGSHP